MDSVNIPGFDDLMISEAMRLLEDPEVRVRLAVGQLLRSLAAKHGLSVLEAVQDTVLNSIHTHFVSPLHGGTRHKHVVLQQLATCSSCQCIEAGHNTLASCHNASMDPGAAFRRGCGLRNSADACQQYAFQL